ncbi:MAG: NADH-ubiquinone oxidoreductase-F iron-sulfur binding region domain-containing protein [Solirubrobacteraceae bacterium]|jgi:NADH:ubiquinone oxidoreductase subunit F (NADH-binding)
MNVTTLISEPPVTAPQPAAPALPRLLAGIRAHGPLDLEGHLAVHGQAPLLRAGRGRRAREQAAGLIEEVERAGLLGRGGAGFPTATKMRAVAKARRGAIVVANAAEGEPASLKDRTLLETLPHLVLDGGILAAEAVGAEELIVCVCESAGQGSERIAQAIEERRRMPGLSGSNPPRLNLSTVPGGYVVGQESALVSHLNGRPAKPTFTPPMPFEQGVRRRPTLVNNAETLAQIALIARHGAGWFRQLGTPSQPGSALVTLSGPVAHPGVYEIEHGASLTSLIDAGGGTTARVRAVLLGGYAGTWIGAEYLQGLGLSNEHLSSHGASLGAGVVLLLSEAACPVAEIAHAAAWLADESAGQCGPCVNGLDAIATTVAEIAAGVAQGKAMARVERLASLVRRRGACGHPDGAVNFILSGFEVFRAEFQDHARHGECEACPNPGELPLPIGGRGVAARRPVA